MAVTEAGNCVVDSKPKLWTRNFVLICLSYFTFCIAFHSLLPTLPIYIEKFGGTTGMAGLAMAALTVSAVIIRPICGWALDRYGRKFILFAGILIFMLPSMVFIFMLPIIPLLLLRFVQGFGWGIGTTSQGTVVSDIIPGKRLGEGLGFYSLANSLSLALAPAIGLFLVDRLSFQSLFINSSVLTAIALFLAMGIKYPKIEISNKVSKMVFMEKAAVRPSMVTLLVTITYSTFLSFLALFVIQKGMATAGVFFTVLAATMFITRPLAGMIVDKMGRVGYDLIVYTSIATIILAMIVIAQTSSALHLALGGILYGIGFGSIQPAMLAMCINSVAPDKKGAANATYWTAFDIGVAAGSVIWGIIAGYFGYVLMFYLNIIPALLILPVYLINNKNNAKLDPV